MAELPALFHEIVPVKAKPAHGNTALALGKLASRADEIYQRMGMFVIDGRPEWLDA